ncbi:hypothetical protein DFH11DRAFT_1547667 [Phellopilus nigrolimitatus]|nr:hypothetical protein DFH11DRAFT_1547667 [Phellopilus nigrolimitatus]
MPDPLHISASPHLSRATHDISPAVHAGVGARRSRTVPDRAAGGGRPAGGVTGATPNSALHNTSPAGPGPHHHIKSKQLEIETSILTMAWFEKLRACSAPGVVQPPPPKFATGDWEVTSWPTSAKMSAQCCDPTASCRSLQPWVAQPVTAQLLELSRPYCLLNFTAVREVFAAVYVIFIIYQHRDNFIKHSGKYFNFILN